MNKKIYDGNYIKIVGMDINAIEATVVVDKNVKDVQEMYEYFLDNLNNDQRNIVWIMLPCSYSI